MDSYVLSESLRVSTCPATFLSELASHAYQQVHALTHLITACYPCKILISASSLLAMTWLETAKVSTGTLDVYGQQTCHRHIG
jgi:hypothetical protein